MNFLIILTIASALVIAAARCIKVVPWVWYAAALALDMVYAYGIVYTLPPAVLQALSIVVQRCALATALFVIVMYCGVFSERSAIRRRIGPIRGELSIIACILAGAHCLNYLASYIGVVTRNVEVIGGNQLASLAIALVLLLLLLVLGITSAKAVRRHMSACVWKRIQRSSYVFFGLIYVHELLILYPSVVKGSQGALATLVVGAVVFGGYYAARMAKWRGDRKDENAQAMGAANGEEECGARIG